MDFTALKQYLRALPETMGIPACAMTVHLGRDTVFEEYVNTEPERLYWLYSATKLFTAVMYCRLMERGLLRGSDPVSDYLPEYGKLTVGLTGDQKPAETVPTLEQLITMCGGLTYDIFSPHIAQAADRSTRGIVREIAKMPLFAQPGETFLYSLCHDVLAAVMEQATGKRYAELLREEIMEPLGMHSTGFHPDALQQGRFMPQFAWNEKEQKAEPCPLTNQFCFSDAYDSGGAGLFSCLGDYILLPEALANGGTGRSGYALLKPETIGQMRRNRLNPAQTEGFRTRWGYRLGSYGYGLGVRTRLNQLDGSGAPVGEFGWDGAAGAYALIDPERKLSVFYVQHVLNMGCGFERNHPKLRDLVYQCL